MPAGIKSCSLFFLPALLLLSSCASLKINPPGPSVQALLVIPVEVDANVVSVRHGFYYVYEVTRVDDTSFSHDVEIKFPIPGDMLIVDSLPPGDYYVRKFTVLPHGVGDKTYGDNSASRHDSFSLESGKITIHSKSLRVVLRNQDPGRIGTIVYNFDIVPVSDARRNSILSTLGEQRNFKLWNIQGGLTGTAFTGQVRTETRPLPAADGTWKGKWWPVTKVGEHGIECKGGEMAIEIEGVNIAGQAVTDDGFQYQLMGNQHSDRDIRGTLHFGKEYYARLTGEVSGKDQIEGEFQFRNDCRSEWHLTRTE